MAIQIQHDGKVQPVASMELESVQAAVGGYLFPIRFRKPVQFDGVTYEFMFVDEDGEPRQRPMNLTASELLVDGGNAYMASGATILGNVVLVNNEEMEEFNGD